MDRPLNIVYWHAILSLKCARKDNIVRKTIKVVPHSLLTHCLKCLEMISFFEDCILRLIFFQTRDCSILTSRVGVGGGVSVFSVMENNCVTENKGEWYFVKGRNFTVKIIIKPFLYYCEEIGTSLI